METATSMDARTPEIRPVCPKPRRPHALFECPSLPASPGPQEDGEGGLIEPLDLESRQSPALPQSREGVYDMFGLAEKRDQPCELRPLSSQSTSAGPSPSPDEALGVLHMMSPRTSSPFWSVEDQWRDVPWRSDFDGSGAPGLCRTTDRPSMPHGPSPDDPPMLVCPSLSYGFSRSAVGRSSSAASSAPPAHSVELTRSMGVAPEVTDSRAACHSHSALEAGVARGAGVGHEQEIGRNARWAPLASMATQDARGSPQPVRLSAALSPYTDPLATRQLQQQQPDLQQRRSNRNFRQSERFQPIACDVAEHQLTVDAIAGMSKTQVGSRLLQRRLLKGHPNVINQILEGIESDLPNIMCNVYGNYLCSASFQACSVAQRLHMIHIASRHLRRIATDKWGTHALQALISLVCTTEEQALLIPALQHHIVELSRDSNGAHVVQRALLGLGASCPDVILSQVCQNVVVIASSPHGLGVLKTCIAQSTCRDSQHALLRGLSLHACELAQAPYGNYAIQHALEEWGGETCLPIIQALRGRLVQLSIQKFSSNVVEHVLNLAPAEVQAHLIEELSSSDRVRVLMSTVCGHYVARCLLQIVPPERRGGLERLLSGSLSGPRSQRLRERWEQMMLLGHQCATARDGAPATGGVEQCAAAVDVAARPAALPDSSTRTTRRARRQGVRRG